MSYQKIETPPPNEQQNHQQEEQHFVDDTQSYQQYEQQSNANEDIEKQEDQQLPINENQQIDQDQLPLAMAAPQENVTLQEHQQLLQDQPITQQYIPPNLDHQTGELSYQSSTSFIDCFPENSSHMNHQIILGDDSQNILCPHCHKPVTTYIESSISVIQIVLFVVLFFIGCVCCSCIPFCIQSFSEITHKCPKCERAIGRRNEVIIIQ